MTPPQEANRIHKKIGGNLLENNPILGHIIALIHSGNMKTEDALIIAIQSLARTNGNLIDQLIDYKSKEFPKTKLEVYVARYATSENSFMIHECASCRKKVKGGQKFVVVSQLRMHLDCFKILKENRNA